MGFARAAHERLIENRAAARIARAFRRAQAHAAAAQARRLLIDDDLLHRLAAVCARSEHRAAALVQWRWRTVKKSRAFQGNLAMKRINHAVVRRRAHKVTRDLQERAAQEQQELIATIKLQAALRRCLARKHAARAAHGRTMGLLRQQWGANRELRAVGRVQRAWVANLASRREKEAMGQAERASLLTLRLARARSAELRVRHFAVLIARQLRTYVQQRMTVTQSLHGWLAKRSQPTSKALPGKRWHRRYFWVAEGRLHYDSVRWRVARSDGWELRHLQHAVAIGACDIRVSFGRAGTVRHAIVLRAADPTAAHYWRNGLLWLAHLPHEPFRLPERHPQRPRVAASPAPLPVSPFQAPAPADEEALAAAAAAEAEAAEEAAPGALISAMRSLENDDGADRVAVEQVQRVLAQNAEARARQVQSPRAEQLARRMVEDIMMEDAPVDL